MISGAAVFPPEPLDPVFLASYAPDMRVLCVLGILVALVIITDVFINDPYPGQWGGLAWALTKAGKLVIAAMMINFAVRRWRSPRDNTSPGSA